MEVATITMENADVFLDELKALSKNVYKDLQSIVVKVGQDIKDDVAEKLQEELTTTRTGVRKTIRTTKYSGARVRVYIPETKHRGRRGHVGRIPLRHFKTRKQRGAGYSVRVYTRRPAVTFKRAFKYNSHLFQRVRPTDKRLPIQKLYGPHPGQVFRKFNMLPATEKQIQEMVRKRLRAKVRDLRFRVLGSRDISYFDV